MRKAYNFSLTACTTTPQRCHKLHAPSKTTFFESVQTDNCSLEVPRQHLTCCIEDFTSVFLALGEVVHVAIDTNQQFSKYKTTDQHKFFSFPHLQPHGDITQAKGAYLDVERTSLEVFQLAQGLHMFVTAYTGQQQCKRQHLSIVTRIRLFLGEDGVLRTECRDVQFRHLLIELCRQKLDFVLVGALVLFQFLNKSSCASTWFVKGHDITKDGWPVV